MEDVEQPKHTGLRFNEGKPKYSLVPSIHPLVEVAMIGAKKYGNHNWKGGMPWSDMYDAMWRHMEAWRSGEQRDPKDGQHHLASVAWNALALIEYEKTHPELNDIQGN